MTDSENAAQESYGAEGLRPCEAPALIDCPRCGGSGFSGYGTGYGDVCSECGGLRQVPERKNALHQNTHQLMRDFSLALAAKLARAEQKYGYRDNWLTDDWEADCRTELMRHIEKGDPLDVAAYCAFMWRRGRSTKGDET